MHKVKNRKVIRRLADKSFQNSRTRNIIAVLAIALTTTLFTTLFTIGMGAIESFQLSTMRQSGGDSHGVIKNLTRKQYNKLKEHPLIKESAPCIFNRRLREESGVSETPSGILVHPGLPL